MRRLVVRAEEELRGAVLQDQPRRKPASVHRSGVCVCASLDTHPLTRESHGCAIADRADLVIVPTSTVNRLRDKGICEYRSAQSQADEGGDSRVGE
jgi:hypothetical protein